MSFIRKKKVLTQQNRCPMGVPISCSQPKVSVGSPVQWTLLWSPTDTLLVVQNQPVPPWGCAQTPKTPKHTAETHTE